MSVSPQKSNEPFSVVLKLYILRQRSIDDLLGHETFWQFLRDHCHRFKLKNFGVVYAFDDLCNDSFIKASKALYRLQIAGDILSEEEFAGWLYVVVRSVVRSKDRQHNKWRRNGVIFSDKSSEEWNLRAPDDNNEYLRMLLDFIKDYPEEHQRAVILWLQGFSFREIEEELKKENREGACVSYGTIRNWVLTILKAFKKTLGL
jgi:DNA-directed RNA polymerase specialized sigma24 family protein